MDNFFKNSLITFFTEMLFFASGFIILVAISRVLGPEGKGIYSLLVLIPGFLVAFGTLGIESANIFYIGSKKYSMKDIIANSAILTVILGIILMFLFYLLTFSNQFQNFLESKNIEIGYLWITVSVIPVILFLNFFRNIIRGQERIKEYNLSRLLDNAFQLVFVVIFVLFLGWQLKGAVLAYVFSFIFSAIVLLFLVARKNKFTMSLNKILLKDSFLYGMKVYLANIVSFLSYRFDIFLVAYYLNPLAVGLYSISAAIAERMFIIPNVVTTILFPKVASIGDDEANDITPKVSRHTIFLMILTCFFAISLVYPFVLFFFGKAFMGAIVPFMILLPGIIAFGIGGVLSADLSGRGRPEFAVYSSIVCMVSNIILNIILIPRYGISGAAISSAASYWLDTLVIIFAFSAISKVAISNFIFIKKEDFSDYYKVLNYMRIHAK